MKNRKSPSKNQKTVQICPQCGSPDIETDFSNPAAVIRGFLHVKKCNNCNHEGTFFPRITLNKLTKPKKTSEVKNKQHFDTTFAQGIYPITLFSVALLLLITSSAFFLYKKPLPGIVALLADVTALILMKRRTKMLC